MDRSSEKIVEYAHRLDVQDLTSARIAACKTHLLDSLACALGGYDAQEYHSQSFLDLVPTILERVSVPQIASIAIETYWLCYSEIGSEPAKWEPDSRETADHSLPFILAIGLRDGSLGLSSFSDANLHDPELRSLMRRISIEHTPSSQIGFRRSSSAG